MKIAGPVFRKRGSLVPSCVLGFSMGVLRAVVLASVPCAFSLPSAENIEVVLECLWSGLGGCRPLFQGLR